MQTIKSKNTFSPIFFPEAYWGMSQVSEAFRLNPSLPWSLSLSASLTWSARRHSFCSMSADEHVKTLLLSTGISHCFFLDCLHVCPTEFLTYWMMEKVFKLKLSFDFLMSFCPIEIKMENKDDGKAWWEMIWTSNQIFDVFYVFDPKQFHPKDDLKVKI